MQPSTSSLIPISNMIYYHNKLYSLVYQPIMNQAGIANGVKGQMENGKWKYFSGKNLAIPPFSRAASHPTFQPHPTFQTPLPNSPNPNFDESGCPDFPGPCINISLSF